MMLESQSWSRWGPGMLNSDSAETAGATDGSGADEKFLPRQGTKANSPKAGV